MPALSWTELTQVSWIKAVALSAAVVAASAGLPLVQPRAQTAATTATFKALMEQGFEVKNVAVLSGALSTTAAQTLEKPTVIVTLQKSAVTAACWMELTLWTSMQISTAACNLLR